MNTRYKPWLPDRHNGHNAFDPPAKKEGEKRTKPRSGRPVTLRSISAAMSGQPLTGPQKTRILRAVNRILEQRKQEPVNIKALF